MAIRRMLAFMLMAACGTASGAAPDQTSAGATDFVQAWLGALEPEVRLPLEAPADEDLHGDLGTLAFGGGAAQRLWSSRRFGVGYEGGALITWKNDATGFFSSTGTLLLIVDNTFLAVGVFMGGLASVQLSQRLRLYAAAGPSLTWARLDTDEPSAEPQSGGSGIVVVDSDSSHSDVSFVPYGRFGLEWEFANGLAVGASARYADDEFDFGSQSDVVADDVLWLLTLGARL